MVLEICYSILKNKICLEVLIRSTSKHSIQGV